MVLQTKRNINVSLIMGHCFTLPVMSVSLLSLSFIELYEPRHEKTSFFRQAKLISAFVFATYIVQSLYFLNPKFQASSYLLWLYSPVCVRPGRKPRRPVFSQRGSYKKALASLCSRAGWFM